MIGHYKALVAKLRDYARNGCRSWVGIADVFNEAAAALEYETLFVGSLAVRRGITPATIWIGQPGGEGGEFSEAEVEAVLQKFYAENF